jgi:HEAT repeat protein
VGALHSALRIRPGEGRVALRFVSLMFVGMSGAAIGANGVESLFFSRFGPEYLPYLYIVLGVVTFALTIAMSGLLASPDPTRVLLAILLSLAAMLIGARLSLAFGARWVYPVLWVVMMVAWTAQIMASWGLAGAVHDTRQAKRLFPLYGSGLILGAVLGGLLTGPLASTLGAENLVLVWSGALIIVFALGGSVTGARLRRGLLSHRRQRAGPLRQMAVALGVVRSSGLLRVMALSLTLFAVLYFTLALVFAEAATDRFPRTDELAGFLGLFMGLSNAAALVVSLLIANRLFARFGVPTMVMALAALYLVGFAGLAIAAPFAGLVAFRFIQMVWVNGIWATGWQALFNVVPSEHRASIRSFMDGGPLQAGVIVSGVLLLLAELVLSARGLYLAGAVAASIAVWATWRARVAYGDAVADALRAGNPDVFRHEDQPFAGVQSDADVVSALVAAASGPDPVARRVAMDILAETSSAEAVPAYRRGLRDPDPEVRAAAVRGLARSGGSEDLADRFAELLRDPEGEVRATAAAALVDLSDERGAVELHEMAGSIDPAWRSAAVARLATAPGGAEVALAALSDPEPAVRISAAAACARADGSRAVASLVETLADPEPSVREAAAASLAVGGREVGERLVDALSRPETEEGALLALARLPDADQDALRAYAAAEASRAVRYHELWRRLDPQGEERLDLVAHALRHRAVTHATKALRALTAVLGPQAAALAIENLDSRDPQQRANALEMLEGAGEREVVRPLLSVWETPPAGDGDSRSALAELLDDEDPWIRECSRYAARGQEGTDLETLSTLSLMDRMLFLRKVGLFEDLSPADLKHVAEAATEHVFPEGHLIAGEGEPGDDMHIVVDGEIAVSVSDPAGSREVARREPGEYVGEMAILDQEPRMASLIASRETRTLSIDRRRFQRILRERPEASLAVMQVLSQRLREATHESRPSPAEEGN